MTKGNKYKYIFKPKRKKINPSNPSNDDSDIISDGDVNDNSDKRKFKICEVNVLKEQLQGSDEGMDSDVTVDDVIPPDNAKAGKVDRIRSSKIVDWNDETDYDKDDVDVDKYFSTDPGPFVVHLSRSDKSDQSQVCDIKIGKILKDNNVRGLIQVKRIGKFLIKLFFNSYDVANDFLGSNLLKKIGCEASIPLANISKSGIIYDVPADYSIQYLKENIRSKLPVMDIFRFSKSLTNQDGTKTKVAAKTIKVTFRGQFLPDEVDFFLSKRKVKPFVPIVTRCYKCLRFGHVQKYCKQAKVNCVNCGESHEGDCDRPTKCFHCKSPHHRASDNECPEYSRNVLIKEAMVCLQGSFLF